MTAVTIVNSGNWCQESYETSSREAGERARQLRKLGYRVRCSAMGPQVTSLGRMTLTLVDVHPGSHADTFDLPKVQVVR
jgi:hypothetical protein